MPRISLFSCLSLGTIACFSGCASPAVSPNPSASASMPRTLNPPRTALLSVLTLPAYQQAEQAYRHKDYQKALAIVQTLLQSPSLSKEDSAFLQTQQTICQKALHPGMKPTLAAKSVPAVRTSRTPAEADCGPRALALACRKLGVKTSLEQLRTAAGTTAQGTSMAGLVRAAHGLGLTADGVQVSREALAEVQPPAVVWVNQNHYVTLLAMQGAGDAATATIRDPNDAADKTIPREQLLRLSGGYLLLLKR